MMVIGLVATIIVWLFVIMAIQDSGSS